MQRSLKTRLGAVYPVKGSELLPRDSSWIWVRGAQCNLVVWEL